MIGHGKLHPGRKGHGAAHGQVGVHIQKQQAVFLQPDAVHGAAFQPLVRDAQVSHAAGQLTGVQPQRTGIRGQGEHRRDLVGQFVVGILGNGQAFPRGIAGAGIVEQLRQGQGGRLVVAAVPCQCGLIVQHLLFQLQTPLCQPGYAFVRELELLLKVGSAAAGRSKGLGGIVVHNGILLLHL